MKKNVFTLLFSITGLVAAAQTGERSQASQPFLFSVNTLTASNKPWNLAYSGSYGDRTSGAFGYDGLDQQLALKGYLGARFTLFAAAAIGFSGSGSLNSFQQAEVMRDFLGGKKTFGPRLGLSLGASRDWNNVKSLFSRVTGSFDLMNWRIGGNLRFEKPFDDARDKIDVITSAGVQRHVGKGFFVGFEAVGQDLEGFWEEDEAEGGAKLFVGPSINVTPKNSRLSFTASGGPVFYATRSQVIPSQAIRDLTTQNGYTVRALVNFNLGR